MIRPSAVIFDLGGVLIDWDPRYLYRSLFPNDPEGMEWFLSNVTTSAWNEQQDRGRTWAEAVTELVAHHPDHADLIRAYHHRWEEMLGGAHEDTVSILAHLKDTGVRLFALTNWSAETFDVARERFGFLGWFDGIVVSGIEHIAKPDVRIFRLLLDRFELLPESSVFVDDSTKNVEQAARLGIDAILFSDAAQLRRDLQARQLLG